MSYTIDIEPNGFGCMYQTKICALAYCKLNDIKYFHTDFKIIHHNTSVDDANRFIGFHNYPKADENTIKLKYDESLYNCNPDLYFNSNVIKEIRDNYYLNKKPKNIYTNYIAIHIRRGDVNEINCPDRFNSIEYYLNLIPKLIKLYPDKKLVVFSEGTINDFIYLEDEFDITIDLDTDGLKVFNSMVEADVLVIARSSFSYLAALLNPNKIHYDVLKNREWFSQPKKEWLVTP